MTARICDLLNFRSNGFPLTIFLAFLALTSCSKPPESRFVGSWTADMNTFVPPGVPPDRLESLREVMLQMSIAISFAGDGTYDRTASLGPSGLVTVNE